MELKLVQNLVRVCILVLTYQLIIYALLFKKGIDGVFYVNLNALDLRKLAKWHVWLPRNFDHNEIAIWLVRDDLLTSAANSWCLASAAAARAPPPFPHQAAWWSPRGWGCRGGR